MQDITISAFADEAASGLADQIKALQKAELSAIDIRSLDGYGITDLPLDHAEKVRAELDAAGIRVHMFGSPIGKTEVTDDPSLELGRLEHLAKLKPILGCSAVRMFSFFNRTELPTAQWAKAALDRLRQIKDRAGELGLVLYHENETHVFGDPIEHVLQIAELRGDSFKLIYDFANFIRTGTPGWETWRQHREVADAFHFKDQLLDGTHVPMGQGDTDALAIVRDALQMGLRLPVTVEPHLPLNPDRPREEEAPARFHEAVLASKAILAEAAS